MYTIYTIADPKADAYRCVCLMKKGIGTLFILPPGSEVLAGKLAGAMNNGNWEKALRILAAQVEINEPEPEPFMTVCPAGKHSVIRTKRPLPCPFCERSES